MPRSAGDQSGFALAELLVAISLISIALLGVMASLDGAGKLTLVAQRHEQAISVAQREIEKMRVHPYAQLELAALPSPETSGNPVSEGDANPRNPNFYVRNVVVGGNTRRHFLVKSNYRVSTSAPPPNVGYPTTTDGEPLVDEIAGGAVAAGPETIAIGDSSVTVWRYVTWRDDPAVDNTACAGVAAAEDPRCTKDSKRLTVAVRPAVLGNIGPTRPVFVSSVVTPPETGGG